MDSSEQARRLEPAARDVPVCGDVSPSGLICDRPAGHPLDGIRGNMHHAVDRRTDRGPHDTFWPGPDG
jgi:hypothetical protein